VQASHPVEPTCASLPHCFVWPVDPDVVTFSSSDTKEALELLFLSPNRDPLSRVSEPSSSSDNDLFEDCPKANDMAVSVYIALTTDASGSRASTADTPHGDQESHAGSSSTRQCCPWAAAVRRSHR
jgi:hypothetical protein